MWATMFFMGVMLLIVFWVFFEVIVPEDSNKPTNDLIKRIYMEVCPKCKCELDEIEVTRVSSELENYRCKNCGFTLYTHWDERPNVGR
jgi:hypothetical protein